MKASHYLGDPNAMELTMPVHAWVRTCQPLLDLSNLFQFACTFRHNSLLNNDDASTHKFLEVLEECLGDLTVKDMINVDQDEFEFDGENIWDCVLRLEHIVTWYERQIPNWQLKMAAMRLERLAKLIIPTYYSMIE